MTWQNRIIGHGEEAPDQLLANPWNFRRHPKDQQAYTEASLEQIGWIDEVLVNTVTGHVIDGHLRIELALRKGEPTVPVKYVDLTEDEEKRALVVFDRITGMAFEDAEVLASLMQEIEIGEDEGLAGLLAELKIGGNESPEPPENRPTLADRFLIPPFSVFNAQQGYWQERKRTWLDLGIQSELGRGGNLVRFSEEATRGVGGKSAPPKSYQHNSTPDASTKT